MKKKHPQTKPRRRARSRLAIKSRVKAGIVIDITGAGFKRGLGFNMNGVDGTEY